MVRMIWGVIRNVVCTVGLVWFICGLGCVWYFKVCMILYVANVVINNYRINCLEKKLKESLYVRKW